MSFTPQDTARLRALAARQTELAQSAEMQALTCAWECHGDFDKASRPMIRIELGTFEQDVLPPLLQCGDAQARQIEVSLLRNLVNHTLFADDTLVPDHFAVTPVFRMTPFGLPVRRQKTEGVGHQFIPYLHELPADAHLLGKSLFEVDVESSARRVETLDALFGDLLPVRQTGYSLSACPMQDIVHIMRMEDLFLAMMDEPESFTQILERLVADYLAFFERLEAQGLLRTAVRGEHLSQGTYCFTSELPGDQPAAKLSQMWLYMDSQETSAISPAMYRELVFPAYKRLMTRFGLVSYGCCEAVHALWDGCLDTLQNLRKVSISPWCDERF
ncbi:MAG: hypothetical protein RR482_10970, partial [Clostridia bacterium]